MTRKKIMIEGAMEFQDEEFQPDAAKMCQQFVLDVVQHIS